MTARGRAERALGRGLRSVVVRGGDGAVTVDGCVRGHVDAEGKLGRELVGAGLQITRVDILAVTEQRALLVVTSGGAGVRGVGLTRLIIVGLAAEDALAIDLFLTFVFDHAHAFGHAIGGLIGRATAVTLRVTVVCTSLVAFAHVAAEMTFGDGVRGAVVGALGRADFVRALGGDRVALFRARFRARLHAGGRVGRGAVRAAHGVSLFRARLFDGSRRAARHAFLLRLELAVGTSRQIYAATLVQGFSVGCAG